MGKKFRFVLLFCTTLAIFSTALPAWAQGGNAGTIQGTVKDPSGAAVPGAAVEIANPVSGFRREAKSGEEGTFTFTNVPFNPYHMVVKAEGFAAYAQDVEIRSGVPVTLAITLKLGAATTKIEVQESGGDLIENEPTFHTDVDRKLFDRLPLESQSSSVSSLVTLATPGVAADSNGLFHGLGDHAENSFSVDGQPITDQQSKVFSNQIPADSIQSLEVISGAPPAEFGEKASLVIKVTTRSGLGVDHPTGSVYSSYGSFGTGNLGFDLALGGKNWGNFIAASGLQSGRFLDPGEFAVMHAKGNEENVFDRVDFQPTTVDAIHLNLGYTRSWFQTPNSFDNLNLGVTDPFGNPVPATDQRAKIGTFNIAPSWTRILGTTSVFTFGVFVRRDRFNYYPSGNPFADLVPNLQRETLAQDRKLTNVGARSDISRVKGIHNFKAGITYQQTFLDEKFSLGIVGQLVNSPCLDASGNPQPSFIGGTLVNDPAQCGGLGLFPNTAANPVATAPFNPTLACLDLTRPTPAISSGCANTTSTAFVFQGHTDVKLLSMYIQDAITKGSWTFNLGIRGDVYNGLANKSEAEPRLGIAYNIKKTNTVLRASYARLMETPFNENLVVSSTGCNVPVIAGLVPCVPAALGPGWRNEFHAGFQQAFGRYFVVDGEWISKYTHHGDDFSVLGATPIFFPISWHNSKIPGYALRASVPNFHGFTALFVMSSVTARYFPPQVGGLGVTVGQSGSVFRIDHDEHFNQTTHLQYQTPWKRGPWLGFNWRYDSGLVGGRVPCAGGNCNNGPLGSNTVVDASRFTPAQQFAAGLFCGPVRATVTTPIRSSLGLNLCPASQYGSTLIKIPAPGTENDDHNPPRIAPRHLFDIAVGEDNLFGGDRYKWSLRFTVINLTNKTALYNFFSTFSGTHYVTPRTETVELGFHF